MELLSRLQRNTKCRKSLGLGCSGTRETVRGELLSEIRENVPLTLMPASELMGLAHRQKQ